MPQSHNNFKIGIRGSFDVRWVDYLGEMLVHVETDEGKIPKTFLFGHSPDLSAFLGTLNALIDLGYPVIAFEYQQADPIGEKEENGVEV